MIAASATRRKTGQVAFIAFTKRGCALAKELSCGLAESAAYDCSSVSVRGPERYSEECGIESYDSLAAWTSEQFACADALVFVGACGIAVRAIAPHVRDKFSDPAVVSIDEAGQFAVPLLSGHVGGANELARVLAGIAGGVAVVSTATDVNGLFAVDEWAARLGLCIVERAVAKEISARLLEGQTVGFMSEIERDWKLPPSIEVFDASSGDCSGEARPEVGFVVSLDEKCQPFERTLHLVSRSVVLGVGCRAQVEPALLAEAVELALAKAGVSPLAVRMIASIDVKQGEPAILELAERHGWDLQFYTAEQLAAVPGDFSGSDFVKRTVGVDNVCERAALVEGDRLLLGKQAHSGTTVAVAVVDSIDDRAPFGGELQ